LTTFLSHRARSLTSLSSPFPALPCPLSSIQVEVFEHALENTPGNDLARVLWLKSRSSEVWLDRRTTYTRSLAVMSMVGYLLGLGDRHPSNLTLDRYSGKILHIDFGDCFEASMQREKFPERVPFRLTRMLVRAMEVSGIEGNFRSTCEGVMAVLRGNKDSVMAMLEAFVHDPLINWRLLNTTAPGENVNQQPGAAVMAVSVVHQEGGGSSGAPTPTTTPGLNNKDRRTPSPGGSDGKTSPAAAVGGGVEGSDGGGGGGRRSASPPKHQHAPTMPPVPEGAPAPAPPPPLPRTPPPVGQERRESPGMGPGEGGAHAHAMPPLSAPAPAAGGYDPGATAGGARDRTSPGPYVAPARRFTPTPTTPAPGEVPIPETLNAEQVAAVAEQEAANYAAASALQRHRVTALDAIEGLDVDTNEVLNDRAVNVMRRMSHKLTGRDGFASSAAMAMSASAGGSHGASTTPGLSGSKHDDVENGTPDGVEAQVQRLIVAATSHENLCQSYIGWCPFW